MTEHKTIFDVDFGLQSADFTFDYQPELTDKLDNLNTPFGQEDINEIVLWKVNRYAPVSNETLFLLNQLNPDAMDMEIELTKSILKALLGTKGVQLPMASTILRFKNKNIYQIIDQRVYRIIYKGKKLKLNSYLTEKNIDDQIQLYLDYLVDLRLVCKRLDIEFKLADRILYTADRRINKDIPLDNYASRLDKIDNE
jgi:hypothetical protein